MAKQTFTTGQTLTAAQMTSLQANDYNWTVSAKTANYVLVATDAGTTITMNSASATTITVNTSLFTAGDTLRIQNIGAGACVVTAGTATVTCAGSLSIPQWGGGTLYFTTAAAAVYFPNAATAGSGLTLVTSQVVGSAVATVTVTGAFSATYDNYLITYNNGTSSATSEFYMQLGATVTNYYWTITGNTWSATASNSGSTTGSAFTYTGGTSSTNGTNMSVRVLSPFLSKRTVVDSEFVATSGGYKMVGMLDNTTSYTSFILAPNTGTITGGTIRVYGYANS